MPDWATLTINLFSINITVAHDQTKWGIIRRGRNRELLFLNFQILINGSEQ